MRYPARLGHLATRKVLVAKLWPTYAEAHQMDAEEAVARLERALEPPLMEQLLAATWEALMAGGKRLDEAGLLEKIAQSLKDRPERPGRQAKPGPEWSALLLLLDLQAGVASEAARGVLERPEGQRMVAAGLATAGSFLAKELTRK
jgi:hypothetical protein